MTIGVRVPHGSDSTGRNPPPPQDAREFILEDPPRGGIAGRSVQSILLAGWCAQHCIVSTYRGAQERGFNVTLFTAAIVGGDKKRRRTVLDLCKTVTVGTFDTPMGVLS